VLPALALALVVVAGCAHAPPKNAQSVAIPPTATLGVEQTEGATLRRALVRELERAPAARPARVPDGGCGQGATCLARVGRKASAELVLSLTLAGLGEMRLVRTRLVRSKDELVLQDLQETTHGGTAGLEGYSAELARRLFPSERPSPWYRTWWFWSAVAVVVGAGTGVTWWLVTRDGPEGDPNVVRIGDL